MDDNRLYPIIKLIESLQVNFNDEDIVKTDKDTTIFDAYFPEWTCTKVLCTKNIDKPFFGIRVHPYIDYNMVSEFIYNNVKLEPKKYTIEFDSKLIDYMYGLPADDVALLAVTFIENTMAGSSSLISSDMFLMYNIDNDISLEPEYYNKEFVNLLKYALTDYMYKLCLGAILNGGAIGMVNPLIPPIVDKLKKKIEFVGTFKIDNKPILLSWIYRIMDDFNNNRSHAIHILKKAIEFTGSVLEKSLYTNLIKDLSLTHNIDEGSIFEYDNTIKSINTYRGNISELATRVSVLESSQNISPEDIKSEYTDILAKSYNNYKTIEKFIAENVINKREYRLYKTLLESYNIIKNKAQQELNSTNTIPIAF